MTADDKAHVLLLVHDFHAALPRTAFLQRKVSRKLYDYLREHLNREAGPP